MQFCFSSPVQTLWPRCRSLCGCLLFILVLVKGSRAAGMVIQALCHQLERQAVLISAGFLDFRAFILEPDFNLWLVQFELVREDLSPLLGDVSAVLKLSLQSLKLLGCERRSGSLVLTRVFLLFQFPGPRSLCEDNNETNPWIISHYKITGLSSRFR